MKHAIAILAAVFSITATAAPVPQATHLWTMNKINEIVGTNTAAKIASATKATLAEAKSYTDAAVAAGGDSSGDLFAAASAATNYTAAAASSATNYADACCRALAVSSTNYTDAATADLICKTGGVFTGEVEFKNGLITSNAVFALSAHIRFVDRSNRFVTGIIYHDEDTGDLIVRSYDVTSGEADPGTVSVVDPILKDGIKFDGRVSSVQTNRLISDFGISNVYTKAETDASISAAVSGIATAATVTNIAEYVVSTNGFATAAAATNAAAAVVASAADYALTNLTGEAVALASGEIGNVTLDNTQTNLSITLDFAASPDRSGDCLLLAFCAADTRLAVGPAETVDILGTLETLKAGTNVVSVTRLKTSGTNSVVMVNVKEIK